MNIRDTGRGPADPWVPLSILAALATAALGLAALTLSGGLASLITGHGWHSPYGFPLVGAVIHGDLGRIWPGVPSGLIVTFTAILGAALLVGLFFAVRAIRGRMPDPTDPARHLAKPADVAHLTTPKLAEQALKLRASLAGQRPEDLDPDDCGALLGRLRPNGPELRRNLEDVELAIMAPRSFKTSAFAIPRVLAAKGACVVTSRRADVWQATAEYRRKRTKGPILVFDPQHIAHHPQEFWVDLLDGIDNVEDAGRLAQHFVAGVADERAREIWGPAARALLSELILAAALDNRSLDDVFAWLVDTSTGVPATILEKHPQFANMARNYRARQAGAVETTQGIYETARSGAACLRDPRTMAWVTKPSTPMQKLNLRHFVRSQGTLYLMSHKGAGSAAPLVAALTDSLFREALRAAEASGGRLDPCLDVILDEAANVCPIGDLPDLYSYLGGAGINVLTILQSIKQGESVWGETGMEMLWGASTIKIIGAGIDDAKLASDLARLIGEHDVNTRSVTRTRDGWSVSESPRRQQIMSAADVRALKKGTALLLATGTRVAMIDLLPWFDHHPERELISEMTREGKQQVQEWAASAYSGTGR
ncbi:TraM recognition domain-containing protein [Streptomyces sp. NPDC047049]|uniref:type IV secretory system conjugative DNA transfer family protein n=1 Tax=Streptomyces sp. NPDC047049 TaxID=3156688 RepID=UPI0033EE2BE2